jgi:hypothetical protein
VRRPIGTSHVSIADSTGPGHLNRGPGRFARCCDVPHGRPTGDELTDVLPADLALVSASATTGTPFANTGTNTVTRNGAIAAGNSVTITDVITWEIRSAGLLL